MAFKCHQVSPNALFPTQQAFCHGKVYTFSYISRYFVSNKWGAAMTPIMKMILKMLHELYVTCRDLIFYKRLGRMRGLGSENGEELPGILNWALRGYERWKAEGLTAPEAVRMAVAGYREEMDALAAFLNDRCVIDRSAMVKSSLLYADYSEWAEGAGERKQSNKKLSTALQERGFDSLRKTDGIYWLGIGLRV